MGNALGNLYGDGHGSGFRVLGPWGHRQAVDGGQAARSRLPHQALASVDAGSGPGDVANPIAEPLQLHERGPPLRVVAAAAGADPLPAEQGDGEAGAVRVELAP